MCKWAGQIARQLRNRGEGSAAAATRCNLPAGDLKERHDERHHMTHRQADDHPKISNLVTLTMTNALSLRSRKKIVSSIWQKPLTRRAYLCRISTEIGWCVVSLALSILLGS